MRSVNTVLNSSNLGLASPKSQLTLQFGETKRGETKSSDKKGGGTKHTLEFGDSSYGGATQYARLDKGEVFLIKSSVNQGLQHGAAALLDHRAIGLTPRDIRRVVITEGNRSREVVQRYPEDRQKAYFADPAVPDEKLRQVTQWIDRVLKVRVRQVENLRKPVGSPRLVLEFSAADAPLGVIKFFEPGESDALAQSSQFASPISVTKANARQSLPTSTP
ncbi:MAG: DUF4340 domain-containing protein [Myxococcota bacterium]